MMEAYRQSWRVHPWFNAFFLCAMSAAWSLYVLLYMAGIPWATQQANVLVFAIAALCLICMFVLPRYGFRLTLTHYVIMAATLLPALPNGQEIIRQSGFLR